MLGSFIALLILIFYLPDSESYNRSETQKGFDQDSSQQGKFQSWKAHLSDDAINKNSAIFADSLAEAYLLENQYDSSAKYFEIAVDLEPSSKRRAGLALATFELSQTKESAIND